MIVRPYQSEDAPKLDVILAANHGHDVRLDRDRIICLGEPGSPTGLLCWRPGGIVHELYVGNGLGQKERADLLVRTAIGDAMSREFKLWEAVFVTDSDRMAQYALNELKATEQVGKRLFTLTVR